jgi:nitroreductase
MSKNKTFKLKGAALMNRERLISEIIRRRYSCRTYREKPIELETRKQLEGYLAGNNQGPLGTGVRFKLIAATAEQRDALKDLGTYGFIKGASGFIVGAVSDSSYCLEDYGYLMEKNILFATGNGLGTCWLGGSFNKSTFSRSISAGENELVPAVAAIGYEATRKRLFDAAIRWGAGSDNRKAAHELFFQGDFQSPVSAAQNGFKSLEMVRLAPSASNRQPWRIVVDETKKMFHFYLQRTKRYYRRNRILFNMADLQRVDMGIAMCHFELTCKEMGLAGSWRVQAPDIGKLPELTEYLATWYLSIQPGEEISR